MSSGPLSGLRVVEMAGIGPAPFGGMLLSDLGAHIVRVDRVGSVQRGDPSKDVLGRGRRSIAIDLKSPSGVETVLRLVESADALIEGYRPGVMERLGLGPQACRERNERLVYARMTGWGQTGPFAALAGHDINYIALNGVLHAVGRHHQPPTPPLNLLGDFGGGGTFLALGVLAGVLEARTSGKGQVVDVAMLDGTASMMGMYQYMRAIGEQTLVRGENMLDTGAHFYDVYECADGRFVAVGAIEPQFYSQLLKLVGLDGDQSVLSQRERATWPEMKTRFEAVFRTKTQAEWCELARGADVCLSPVLSVDESLEHPHNLERQTYVTEFGVVQAAPSPRFSRTPGSIQGPPPLPGQDTDDVLMEWGFAEGEIAALRADAVIA